MGELYKLMEQEVSLHSWIKELEEKRYEDDLTNINKYQDLYNVYYNIVNRINKLKGGE